MPSEPHGWEHYYRKLPNTYRHLPHEDAEGIHLLFQVDNVDKILDLGCGDGRHLKYFGMHGYRMYGIDLSPSALRLAEDWLTAEGLTADLTCSDMIDLPWSTAFFDAIISVQVINHGFLADIQKTIKEISRVLKPGGWFFLCVQTGPPRETSADRDIKFVAPNTYIHTSNYEIKVPHYCFTTD